VEDVISRHVDHSGVSKPTSLETLIFEECNISFHALEVLLKLPKALKNLTLGERMHHTSDTDPLGLRPKFLVALLPQRASLKYFKHVGGGKYWSQAYLLPFFCEDISVLHALETLELGPALDRKYITQGLPLSLQKIRFLDVFQTDLHGKASLFKNPMWSPTFQNSRIRHQIDLVLYRGQDLDLLWSDKDRREEVNKVATKFRKQNTELAIYTPKPCERPLIPPYMYGEELPEEELSYTSINPNLFADTFYELGSGVRDTDETGLAIGLATLEIDGSEDEGSE
jgi:hypothetical protein